MDLVVVIVSYNTRDLLRKCLLSIPEAVRGLQAETIVVDNVSPDGSADMVAAEFPGVRLIRSETNQGFSRANNIAIAQSQSDYVVILNPDTEAFPGSLSTLVKFLKEHPDVGACGPKLLNSDGSLQRN